MTEYVVFQLQNGISGENERWEECVTVEARSARAAIQSAMLNETQGGTMVAVPKRSWQPVQVKVETKTALKFS